MKSSLRVLLAAAAVAGCLSGCATFPTLFGSAGPKMSVSPTIPAAEGTVRFARATNDNTSIDLKVHHLANPEKLTPPAKNYVVWVRASQTAPPQNIGALTVDNNLTGTLRTVTSLHSFGLSITAEVTGEVQAPTGPPLLWIEHND